MNPVLFIPVSIQPYVRALRAFARWLPYAGLTRSCPICGRSSRRFAQFGRPPRLQARCMFCNALERHRFLWLFLERRAELLHNGTLRLLHIAPEACLAAGLRRLAGPAYLSADLFDSAAMEKMDICDIRHPDASFDAIYCSHVLEHVVDDRKAMREFRRVLREEGWAILLVPITAAHTFENPGVTDPKERLSLFGQEDHVRRYGPDYVDRLREAGFDVQVYVPSDLFSPEEIFRYGLHGAVGEIFLCTPVTSIAPGASGHDSASRTR